MQSSTPGFDTADTLSTSDESGAGKLFAKLLTRESSSASASFTKRQSVRRSFSLFQDFQFASLIRSHSTSSRKSAVVQTPDITSSAFFSGYADQGSQFAQANPTQDMLSKHNEERPSRKLKSENRLYNFLTRSRSRSRSKNDSPSAELPTTMPDLPSKPRTSHRLSTAPPRTDSPGSKPPSRLQSRPLSSTTTATNTTITPGTPKPRNHRPSIPAVVDSPPRPTTPKASGARQKLHDFFSIPLGRKSSNSRSRSRSRPSSPRVSLDVPPLPTAGIDDDPTPRPRKSYAPPPPLPPRSPSPTPEPKVLRVTNATTTSSSTGSTAPSASIKISKFFSSKGSTPEPSLPKPKQSHSSSPSGPPVLPPIPVLSIVSAPLKRVSSLHRRSSLKVHDPAAAEPPAYSSASGSAINLGLNVNLGPPKITHTPPTPLKNPSGSSSTSNSKGSTGTGSGSGGSSSTQPPLSSRLGYQGHAAKGSLDSSYRYRGGMGVVNEEGLGMGAPSSSARKGKARLETGGSASGHGHDQSSGLPLPLPRAGSRLSSSARATKHGSFDFERPGWGGGVASGAMQRTGSNGTTNSAWSKNSENKEKERDSTYGPGLAGVGTLQRDLSVKRAQEREDMVRMKEKTRRAEPEKERSRDRDRDRGKEGERPSTSQRTTPGSSTTPSGSEHVHNSTSTAGTGTGTGGKTSSMSKATGRRALLKAASGTGVTRLIGLSPAQHPPFSFEPPVPSPTRSTGTASTGTAHEVVLPSSWNSKAEKERERVREEKERLMGKRGSVKRGDRAPVPVPAVSPNANVGYGHGHGYRSGTKGRSLDLGLGLAWAPSKVREEALLPSSAFFARSMSGSSGNGHGHAMARTGSGSTGRSASGSGRSRDGDGDRDVERSKLGREVAEVFKNALEPEGYKLFRTYVHQFDAHEIPFDGPMGIVSRVEHLLVSAPHLGDEGKRRLLDNFVRIILQQA